jgi:hypothetical protein
LAVCNHTPYQSPQRRQVQTWQSYLCQLFWKLAAVPDTGRVWSSNKVQAHQQLWLSHVRIPMGCPATLTELPPALLSSRRRSATSPTPANTSRSPSVETSRGARWKLMLLATSSSGHALRTDRVLDETDLSPLRVLPRLPLLAPLRVLRRDRRPPSWLLLLLSGASSVAAAAAAAAGAGHEPAVVNPAAASTATCPAPVLLLLVLRRVEGSRSAASLGAADAAAAVGAGGIRMTVRGLAK